jgi:hypothetical protein
MNLNYEGKDDNIEVNLYSWILDNIFGNSVTGIQNYDSFIKFNDIIQYLMRNKNINISDSTSIKIFNVSDFYEKHKDSWKEKHSDMMKFYFELDTILHDYSNRVILENKNKNEISKMNSSEILEFIDNKYLEENNMKRKRSMSLPQNNKKIKRSVPPQIDIAKNNNKRNRSVSTETDSKSVFKFTRKHSK